MSHLLKLSPELLMQIFAASDTILDALHLSATNRLLHDVWLEQREPIIESILKSSIPAYDEAVKLDLLETRLESPIDDSPTPLLRGCLPLLLRNTDLCASACLTYTLECKDAMSPPESYYLLRRIGLGFIHYQLRDDLYLELRSMSRDELEGPRCLSNWLDGLASWDEKVRQGIREDWQHDEVDIMGDWETSWDYAEYMLTGAINDINQSTNNLSIMVEGYDPWDDYYPFFNHIVNPKIML